MRVPDYYSVLQVDPTAETDVIRAAYRCLARKYHPDMGSGSAERMARLNEAWSVLRDPVRRARYDRDRLRSRPPAVEARAYDGETVSTAPVPPPKPPRSRTGGLPQRPARAAGGGSIPGDSAFSPGATPAAASPGIPSDGSTVLDFGRYAGWSIGDVARQDPDFLEWLARTPIGRRYQREIVAILAAQPPAPAPIASQPRHGRRRLFF